MKDQLKDLLKNGLVKDVFHAEMNLAIFKRIADDFEFLKTTDPEYQSLLGYLQISANSQILLALSRLYDKPSKKYPTRCILSLLDFIKKNINSLPEIVEKTNTIECIRSYHPIDGSVDYLIEGITKDDPSIFPERFYKFYSIQHVQDDIQEPLNSIKITRDKIVAHNENYEIQGFESVKNSGVVRLISFAQEIVGVLGWAYLSTVYHTNGNYLLSHNAIQNSHFIEFLIYKIKEDKA